MIVGMKEWINEQICFCIHCNHASFKATLWEWGCIWKMWIMIKMWLKAGTHVKISLCVLLSPWQWLTCAVLSQVPQEAVWNRELCTSFSLYLRGASSIHYVCVLDDLADLELGASSILFVLLGSYKTFCLWQRNYVFKQPW